MATTRRRGSDQSWSEERLDQVIGRADSIAANLQQGKGTVGQLLTDPAAAEELQSLLMKANQAAEQLQVTLENLRSASGELHLASTNLPVISRALSNEARELPGLVLQTQVSMRELERLIEAMQRHWLLRKYVNRTNPPPLRPLPPSEESKKERVEGLRSPKNSTR